MTTPPLVRSQRPVDVTMRGCEGERHDPRRSVPPGPLSILCNVSRCQEVLACSAAKMGTSCHVNNSFCLMQDFRINVACPMRRELTFETLDTRPLPIQITPCDIESCLCHLPFQQTCLPYRQHTQRMWNH